MNLTCAIVDDEPLALDLLESYVNKTPFLTLKGKYSSAVQAMKELPDKQVDLLFLDIQMPELNGLEFSKMVDAHTRIVFSTAFEQYAIDGSILRIVHRKLRVFFYDFLSREEAYMHEGRPGASTINIVFQRELGKEATQEEIESIFVKSDYKLVQIELKKILYVEGLKDYVKIYTEDTARPILSLMSMKSMEELLPTSRFMRVHRSYIVQKEKIRVIDRGRIVFDKTYIPVSDSYKQVFQTFLDKRS